MLGLDYWYGTFMLLCAQCQQRLVLPVLEMGGLAKSGSQQDYDNTYDACIYQTTTNYSNGGYGGVGQGYNQAGHWSNWRHITLGNGGNGGSFGQAGTLALLVITEMAQRVKGAAGNYIRGIGIGYISFTDNGSVQGVQRNAVHSRRD